MHVSNKKRLLGLLASMVLGAAFLALPAKANPYDGSGVYSASEPGCVPAVQALLWYDVGFIIFSRRLRDSEERRLIKEGAKPACWLGKVSKALGIPHRRLYTPSESRRIRAWFASHH